jgi:hypothetical protein
MNAIEARCSSLIVAAALLFLASCATVEPGIEPEPLMMQLSTTTTDNQTDSVLKYSGESAPSGQAEFVTITDSSGNTLFEEAIPPDKQVTVPVQADGKLFVSTRWTDGRTRQEMNIIAPDAMQSVQGGNVLLSLNESTLLYSATTPAASQSPTQDQTTADAVSTGAAKPSPDEITIEDGEGEILYWGFFRDRLEVDATDDTLICTIKWTDGKTTRQEISLTDNQVFYDEWGDYVVFKWDDLARQYSLQTHKETQLMRDLRAAVIDLEAGTFGDKPPTAGVVTGADEPLLEGSDEISYQGFNLGLTFGKWKRFVPSIELGAAWGDGDTSRELAGVNSGWANQGGDSPGGSPGVASVGGTRASLETDYEKQHFSLTLSDKFKLKKDSQASFDYSFLLQRSVRDYRGEVALLAFPDITSTDKQEITEYDLGLGIGLRGRHTFNNKWALSGLIGLDAVYYRGDYDGTHQYDCNLCAPSDQAFTQSTRDKEDGFTWGTRLSARASYHVKTNSELYLGLNYRYQDEAPVLRNRTAPGDPEPYLDTYKLDWQNIHLGFIHRY